MSDETGPLDALRREIADTDRAILEAVARRMQLARRVGEAKSAAGLPVRDFRTEKEVMERTRALCRQLALDTELGEHVMRWLIHGAVKVQEGLVDGGAAGALRQVLVVGGNGRMGRWLARFLNGQGHDVGIHDPRGAPAGMPSLPLAAARDRDVVIVATPLEATAATLTRILELEPRGLVFDVASVKTPFVELLRQHAGRGIKVGSAHPMFGADVDLLSGRHLVICRCGNDDAVREIGDLFRETTLELTELEIEQHDALIAYVLGLSHALNIAFFEALRRSGHDFDALLGVASTTFLKQARTASEVARENPRLYYEIQHANAARERVFEVFGAAVSTLRQATRDDDPRAFHRLIEAGREYFGTWAPGEVL